MAKFNHKFISGVLDVSANTASGCYVAMVLNTKTKQIYLFLPDEPTSYANARKESYNVLRDIESNLDSPAWEAQ